MHVLRHLDRESFNVLHSHVHHFSGHPRFERHTAEAILDASYFHMRRGIQQMYDIYFESVAAFRPISPVPAIPVGSNRG